MNSLFSLSPLDGRYQNTVQGLGDFFSEAALMKYRLKVEVEWFLFLCNEVQLDRTRVLDQAAMGRLRLLYEDFDEEDAQAIKDYEATTNHDVKAIEYFIKDRMGDELKDLKEFVHFACTSEDINNLSYALMIKDALECIILEQQRGILQQLFGMAQKYKSESMLSRTHGQSASPTTMGKELINVVARLERQYAQLHEQEILGKINGAVGNFNAHLSAYPDVDWFGVSKKFVQDLGLTHQPYTTQIEPHDYMSEIFHIMMRFNTICIDLSRDIWSYVSLGFFKQRVKEGEIGSSTMPHKVNPINFENAEGNFGMANALFSHFADKLPISRMQRDLSDSTVQRNIGTAFGYSLLAYENLMRGLAKLEMNTAAMQVDLENNWEVLAEPIQTVMRRYAVEGAYEKLKAFTRGKDVGADSVKGFIAGLDIPDEAKKVLSEMTPATYVGMAERLVETYKLGF